MAEQLLGRIAHQRAQLRIHAQKLPFGVHFDDAHSGVLVGRGEPLVLLPQQFFCPRPLRHVHRKTADVHKFSVARTHVGGNEHMPYRAVLGA